MPLPKLTIASIKRSATDQSFSRGESYFRSGAVAAATLRQQTLHAEVEGNEVEPYQVTVTFDKGGVTKARCSCPYSFGGWCKHTVATLLVCLHQPEAIEERPPLSQLLEKLTLPQIKDLVQKLVDESPYLLETIDFHISTLASTPKTPPEHKSSRKTTVNPEPYKRRVREILNEAVRGWECGQNDDSIAYDMADLMREAIAFAEKGDGGNAMVLLKGITESCVQYWHIVDDFIGMDPIDFDIDFDSAWAEVLLTANLSKDQIPAQQSQLEAWQDSLGSFDMALEALRQGWDYPPLQHVFQGEITEAGAWAGEAPDWANEFTQIRLKILNQQERYEDYLLLAEAEGQTQEYLTMLGQLGRTEQAMDVAREEMTDLQEAKALAEILRAKEQLPQALEIAMKGIHLYEGSSRITFEFASWTRDLAEGLGDRPAALEASIAAFQAQPSLKDYQTIKELSEENWPNIKEQLLQQIRSMETWTETDAQIDILLHESLLDDAIKKVSDFSSYHDQLTLKVMDAAITTHTQWVIEAATSRANAIMDKGKAKYYDTAIKWLKQAKAAYLGSNKASAWQRYRRQLSDDHGRKRKLMGLLEENQL